MHRAPVEIAVTSSGDVVEAEPMKKFQKERWLVASLPVLILITFAITTTISGKPGLGIAAFFIILSIAISIYLGYRVQSNLINPLEETISGLYQKTRAGLNIDELRDLFPALESYISHLGQEFEDEKGTLNEEIVTLKGKYAGLRRYNSEILDSLESVDQDTSEPNLEEKVLRDLSLSELKSIIGFTNRINDPGTLVNAKRADLSNCINQITQAVRSLEFLVQESAGVQPSSEKCEVEPWQIADDTLALLCPITDRLQYNVFVNINKLCPATLNVASGILPSVLFHYLLYYFLHNQSPGRQEQNHDLTLEISFSPENELIFEIDSKNYPHSTKASKRLLELTCQEVSLEGGLLSLSAGSDTSMQNPSGQGLTGIIICDAILQRESLHSRLTQLGVQIVDDFKATKLDFCIVDDETGEAFKAVQGYLKPDANILLLNNKTLYERKYWHQLRHPLDQYELKQLLTLIKPANQATEIYEILVVDDNEANLRLLELQLLELGHNVSTAIDGFQAVNLCTEHQFDLVFLDILMPGMDGTETTRLIHELEVIIPPIVGVTAHATNEERQSYLTAGMSEVIVKPIRMEMLKSVLHRQINLPDTKPALPATRIQVLSLFDFNLSLSVARERPELAAEFLQILILNLPADQEQINNAFKRNDGIALKASVHKLNGAVKYCGVPRLANAIDKLESIVKTSSEDHARRALKLLNNEISSLLKWYSDNPEPFGKQAGSVGNT